MSLLSSNINGSYLERVVKYVRSISYKTIILTFVIVLSLIIVLLYYNKTIKTLFVKNDKLQSDYSDTIESNTNKNNTNSCELLFFHVKWCPYCKTAVPIIDEIRDEYQNKVINGYNVIFTDIDCTVETPEIENLINKYKIEGYPTIKLIKDGVIIDFEAKPTKDSIISFLNSAI